MKYMSAWSPMKLPMALAIALCPFLAADCMAADDLAGARKELRAALDVVVEKYPELDDVTAYFASRTKGSNGWDDFVRLSERCAKIVEDGGDAMLFFQYIHDPSPSAYGEEELILLRSGLKATKPIADAAERLLEFDCIVPDASFVNLLAGNSRRFFNLSDLTSVLTSRAVAMSAVGAGAGNAAEAAMFSYRLTMKVDISMNLLGCSATNGWRDSAFMVGLRIAETLDKPDGMLAQLKDVRASRNFGPRDWWFGELAFVVALSRKHISLDDEALRKESNEHPDYKGKPAEMLTDGGRHLELAAAVLAAFPTSDRISLPEHTGTLVKALDAAKSEEYAREDYVFGNLQMCLNALVNTDLRMDARRLQLELRLHEARRGSWPDEKATVTVLKDFPGLEVRRDDEGLEIHAAADHPVRRLMKEKLLQLSLKLKPWVKK